MSRTFQRLSNQKTRWCWGAFALALLAMAGAAAARADEDQRVKCGEFSLMPAKERVIFTKGMLNGLGLMMGVMDTFERLLEEKALNAQEKKGIEGMHAMPIGFLNLRTCCQNAEAIATELSSMCRASPDRYVGNFLTDVLSKRAEQDR